MSIRTISSYLILIIIAISAADEFKVISLEEDLWDFAARDSKVRDEKGINCAVIKIHSDIQGISIESNPSVLNVREKIGEKHFYFSSEVREITLISDNFKPYTIPIALKANSVYNLTITSLETYSKKISELEIISDQKDFIVTTESNSPLFCNDFSATYLLNNGKYNFLFQKSGYADINKEITIDSNQKVLIFFEEGASSVSADSLVAVTINTVPSVSDVYLNSRHLGKTPLTVKLFPHIEYRDFKIEKKDYVTQYQKVLVVENYKILNFALKSKYCVYRINSNPEGADVYFDGELLGKTPLPNYSSLKSDFVIWFEKNKYYPKGINVISTGEKSRDFDVDLVPKWGHLEILSDPTNADVFIGGRYIGKTPFYRYEVESREYDITIKKENWIDEEDIVFITDLDTIREFYNLKPSKQLSSILKLNGLDPVNPLLTKFYMDGVESEQSILDTLYLKNGVYRFEIFHPEYFDKSIELNLQQGIRIVDLKLKSIKKTKFKWALSKWTSLGLAACGIGGAYYFNNKANDYYDDYLKALNSVDADRLYSKTKEYDNFRNISAGASLLNLIWYVISGNNQSGCDNKTTWHLK